MKMKVYNIAAAVKNGPFGEQWQCVSSISCADARMSKLEVFEDYVRDQTLKNPGLQFADAVYVDELSIPDLEKYLEIAKQE